MEAIRVKRFLAGAMTFGMLVGSVLGNSLSLHAASPKDLVPVSVEDMRGDTSFIADYLVTYETDKTMFEPLINDLLGVSYAKIAGKSISEWTPKEISNWIYTRVPSLIRDGADHYSSDQRWVAVDLPMDDQWLVFINGTTQDEPVTPANVDYYLHSSGGGPSGTSSMGFGATSGLTLGNASHLSTLSSVNEIRFSDLFVDRTDVVYRFPDDSMLEFYTDKDDSAKKWVNYSIRDVGGLAFRYEAGQLVWIQVETYEGKSLPAGVNTEETPGAMYRMYNSHSGEHFYTASNVERSVLQWIGWAYEGIAWIAPTSSNTPVYRLYNPNSGEHHYTTSAGERDVLLSIGWNDEGIGWYSNDSKATPMYRLYNPNAKGQYEAGAHHYTRDLNEVNTLVGIGWNAEGTGWYGL